MEEPDLRAHYDSGDSLQSKLRKAVIATVPQRVFGIAKEFSIIIWIDVSAKTGVIELRYAVKQMQKDHSSLLQKFPIFEEGSKELLRLHAAQRLGLDMDDQIVAVTAPRVRDIVTKFVDDFVSFRNKEPQDETRNIQSKLTQTI